MLKKLTLLLYLAPLLLLAATANSQVGCEENCDAVTVPEPGTLALLGIGIAAMAIARMRKKR